MNKFISNLRVTKLTAAQLAIAILFMGVPFSASAAVTVDVKANGSDGPVTLTTGASYTYSWNSTGATTCEVTSPFPSGITLSGTSSAVMPGESFYYPTTGNPVTITVSCTDGTVTSTDSVVINLGSTPAPAVTVDIKANSSDGPITIASTTSYTYSWTSSNASTCQITSPFPSGITLSGTSSAVMPGEAFYYPTVGNPVTITLSCTDGSTTATDSVVINLASGGGVGVTADIKANGSDGPVTLASGASYTYSWVSTGATTCQITSPFPSGITLNGTSSQVVPGEAFYYPTVGSPVTITFSCTNGSVTATDSVVIQLASGGGGGSGGVTVDIKANGSDGPVTIASGTPYVYSWTSTGATTCQITSPFPSGITLNGTSSSVVAGEAFYYPTLGNPVTITFSCTNGSVTATDSVVIQLEVPSGGGGGGGGGGSSSGGNSNPGEVLGETATNFCPYLSTYMRMGQANDVYEVIKLQSFLKAFEGYDYVTVSGVYDAATAQAVSAFQLKYQSEVLTPWGISAPTGYAYITTVGKINQIICGSGIPGVPHYAPAKVISKEGGHSKEGMGSTTLNVIPVVGNNIKNDTDKGHSLKDRMPNGLAAALFSWPDTAMDTLQCLYELLLILIVLYIVGNVLESVFYKDTRENVLKRFRTKWITITVGLALAFIGAYMLKEWCLLLPLLIAFIASLIWLFAGKNRDKFKAVAHSMYASSVEKMKTGSPSKITRDEIVKERTDIIVTEEKK